MSCNNSSNHIASQQHSNRSQHIGEAAQHGVRIEQENSAGERVGPQQQPYPAGMDAGLDNNKLAQSDEHVGQADGAADEVVCMPDDMPAKRRPTAGDDD